MKNIIFIVLILSLIFVINTKKAASARPSCPSPFVDEKCIASENKRIHTKVDRLCVKKRYGVCTMRNRCCTRVKKCRAGVCRKYKPTCKWSGKQIKRKNCGKQKCSMQKFGNCHFRKNCCNLRGKKCFWVGKKVATGKCREQRVCSTRRIGTCHLRRRCCNKNGKKCSWGKLVKTGECNGAVCTLKKVGKCTVRKSCCHNKKCKFFGPHIAYKKHRCLPKVCKTVRGKCSKRRRCCQGSKCKWIGKKIKTQCRKEVCTNVSVGNCFTRKRCCNKKGKNCRWTGKKIAKKCFQGKKKCTFVRRGKCSKRLLCCNSSKCCPKRQCKWSGKKVAMKCVKETCSFKKFSKCSLRKRCCNKKGKNCRWSGKPINFKCKRVCRMKKFNKCHDKKECCDVDGANCKWVGNSKKNGKCSKKVKCTFRGVGNCKRRLYCCRGTKKGRKCFWKGKTSNRKNCKQPEDCKMKKTGKCTVRRQCCVGNKCRWASNNMKIKGCDKTPVKNVPCLMFADPHARTLKGVGFEAQKAGDLALYLGDHLNVHYRATQQRGWTSIVKIGVEMGRLRFISTDMSLTNWMVNGVVRAINGQNKFGLVTVTRNGNTIIFNTNQGETLTVVTKGWYFDTYITSNIGDSKGICSKQFIQSRFFAHPVKDHDVEDKKKCLKKKLYKRKCLKLNLSGKKLKTCIFDLCKGMKFDVVKDIHDEVEKINTKCRVIKVNKCFERKKCCLIKKGKEFKCKLGRLFMLANCGKKVCQLKRISKCSVRKFCCQNKKCQWSGKAIKEGNCGFFIGNKKCTMKSVGKCVLRRHCCQKRGNRYVCSFEGKQIKDKRCGKTVCRSFAVGACLERKQCCTNGKCAWEGHNMRIRGCNPPPTRMVQCSSYADPHM
jgi:hypothetical protein